MINSSKFASKERLADPQDEGPHGGLATPGSPHEEDLRTDSWSVTFLGASSTFANLLLHGCGLEVARREAMVVVLVQPRYIGACVSRDRSSATNTSAFSPGRDVILLGCNVMIHFLSTLLVRLSVSLLPHNNLEFPLVPASDLRGHLDCR